MFVELRLRREKFAADISNARADLIKQVGDLGKAASSNLGDMGVGGMLSGISAKTQEFFGKHLARQEELDRRADAREQARMKAREEREDKALARQKEVAEKSRKIADDLEKSTKPAKLADAETSLAKAEAYLRDKQARLEAAQKAAQENPDSKGAQTAVRKAEGVAEGARARLLRWQKDVADLRGKWDEGGKEKMEEAQKNAAEQEQKLASMQAKFDARKAVRNAGVDPDPEGTMRRRKEAEESAKELESKESSRAANSASAQKFLEKTAKMEDDERARRRAAEEKFEKEFPDPTMEARKQAMARVAREREFNEQVNKLNERSANERKEDDKREAEERRLLGAKNLKDREKQNREAEQEKRDALAREVAFNKKVIDEVTAAAMAKARAESAAELKEMKAADRAKKAADREAARESGRPTPPGGPHIGTVGLSLMRELGRAASSMTSTVGGAFATVAGAVTDFAGEIVSSANRIANSNFARVLGAGLVGLGGMALTASDSYQRMHISLDSLLGSAEKGGKFFDELQEFARRTPFTFKQIGGFSQVLLTAGFEAKDLIGIMERLGDVISLRGVGDPAATMLHVIQVMQKIKDSATSTNRELRQLVIAGFPITDALAKRMGVAPDQIKNILKHGQISSQTAFAAMMDVGNDPKFRGGMEKISPSVGVMFTKIKDEASQWLEIAGKPLVNAIKGVVEEITDFLRSPAGKEMATIFAETFTSVVDSVRPIVRIFAPVMPYILGFLASLGAMAIVVPVVSAVLGVFTSAVSLALAPLGLMWSLLSLINVQKVVGFAMWAVWTAAVFTANVAVVLFTAQLIVFNAVIAAGGAVKALWTAASLLAAKATLFFSAAVALLNTQLGIAAVLATAGTIVILSIVFAKIAASAMAAYGVIMAIPGAIASLATGPINVISALFGEWLDILKEVYYTAQEDIPNAWAILQAGAELAVEEIKQLWPPLWEFLKNGFAALADFAASTFEIKFKEAMDRIKSYAWDTGKTIAWNFSVPGLAYNAHKWTMKKLLGGDDENVGPTAEEKREAAADAADKKLKEAAAAFAKAMKEGDSEATKAARERLRNAQEKSDDAAWERFFSEFDEIDKKDNRSPDPDLGGKLPNLFKFSGFEEMWKKTQEAISGESMIDFAKRTATATEKSAEEAEKTSAAVASVAEEVKKLNPGALI